MVKKDYYQMFVGLSCDVVALVTLLEEGMKKYDDASFSRVLANMHHAQKQMHERQKELLEVLLHDFLPPLERPDIMVLSRSMESLGDVMMDIASYVDVSRVMQISLLRSEIQGVVALLRDQCHTLTLVIEELKYRKKRSTIFLYLDQLHALQQASDKLYFDAIRKLHRCAATTKDFLVYTCIFDACRGGSKVCHEVVDVVWLIIITSV